MGKLLTETESFRAMNSPSKLSDISQTGNKFAPQTNVPHVMRVCGIQSECVHMLENKKKKDKKKKDKKNKNKHKDDKDTINSPDTSVVREDL